MSRKMKLVAMWCACAALVASCGAPDPGSRTDAGTTCRADLDCDDNLFCTGAERCAPTSSEADASGCVPGAPPCAAGLCDETARACEVACTDVDRDGHSAATCGGDDCDDADGNRFPGNSEVCDATGHDEDCDPCTVGSRDLDNDLFIDVLCSNPYPTGLAPSCGVAVHVDAALGVVRGLDCRDNVAEINPSQAETCNAIDDDCDLRVDENLSLAPYWPDVDMDQYGDEDTSPVLACSPPEGSADVAGDCDDSNPFVRLLATELCDGLDNDCDTRVDEQSNSYTFYRDTDGDGVGDSAFPIEEASCTPPMGHSALAADCDDGNALVYPNAPELCDRIDNNCSSTADPGGLAADEDPDGDGHAPAGASCDSSADNTLPADDCDETKTWVHGGAAEFCSSVDEDCDEAIDEAGQDVCAPGDTCNLGCESRRDLAVGENNACVLHSDATVGCWGRDYPNGLTQVAGLSAVQAVVVGSAHACAVLEDRTVRCWSNGFGANSHGQLGIGHAMEVTGLATPTGLTDVVGLSAGAQHTCALQGSGRVWCWGRNTFGSAGLGHTGNVYEPGRVLGLEGVVEVEASAQGACARRGDGRMSCWGREPLGDGTNQPSSTPVLLALSGVSELASSISSLSGRGIMCARLPTAWHCWGNGHIVNGNDVMVLAPTPLALAELADELAFTGGVGCSRRDGEVSCWGSFHNLDPYTQAVQPDGVQLASAPLDVTLPTSPDNIACGLYMCCGRTDLEVTCWGKWSLDLHAGYPYPQPNTPVGLQHPTDFAVDSNVACAVDDGGAQCWGSNPGLPGFDDDLERRLPTPLPVPHVVGVSTWNNRSCVVDNLGAVFCWGAGSLGDAAATRGSRVPLQVDGSLMGAVTDVVVGGSGLSSEEPFSCALNVLGAIWCWSEGAQASCGNGGLSCTAPSPVSGGHTFTSLAAESGHVCGVTAGGDLYCWGIGSRGRLGAGNNSSSNTPQQVVGPGGSGFLDGVVSVAMAGVATCALRTDGTVWCFGFGAGYRLGNGSTADSNVPLQVPSLPPVDALACGSGACLARLADGSSTWMGWGDNGDERLGAGMVTTLPTPAAAAFGMSFARIWLFGATGCGVDGAGDALCWGSPGFSLNNRALPPTTTQSVP